ncbi:hypothetical protein L596_007554 [Steinernema carpocapsae]|uniref:Uncharacterized protein n=1 Tax=Steinernema carpocapsae TaxID=34508 RepID=A0A4U5PAB2_STECR|nr:hypothetical protein L596_007554 [Steinernema carpocapsae]
MMRVLLPTPRNPKIPDSADSLRTVSVNSTAAPRQSASRWKFRKIHFCHFACERRRHWICERYRDSQLAVCNKSSHARIVRFVLASFSFAPSAIIVLLIVWWRDAWFVCDSKERLKYF